MWGKTAKLRALERFKRDLLEEAVQLKKIGSATNRWSRLPRDCLLAIMEMAWPSMCMHVVCKGWIVRIRNVTFEQLRTLMLVNRAAEQLEEDRRVLARQQFDREQERDREFAAAASLHNYVEISATRRRKAKKHQQPVIIEDDGKMLA